MAAARCVSGCSGNSEIAAPHLAMMSLFPSIELWALLTVFQGISSHNGQVCNAAPQHLIPAVVMGMAINIILLLIFYHKRLSAPRHGPGPTLWCCPFLPSRKASRAPATDPEGHEGQDVVVVYVPRVLCIALFCHLGVWLPCAALVREG
jgi:hypothetical protein